LDKSPISNFKLRSKRLAAGITESQVAEEVARLVAAQTGRELAIDGNYVSKLERGVITWPNRAYRQAFRTLFGVANDADLGFYPSRTRRDAERMEAMALMENGAPVMTMLSRRPVVPPAP
jgi:transcriptional regulator with XRE-family HTH domain